MTDEVLFYRRFIEDVRRCASAHAPASVAEIERRCKLAMEASPTLRDRAWARLVAAVSELLLTIPEHEAGAAARLRAFARENADLQRPRDVAVTDFRFRMTPAGLVADRDGRRYLVFAPIPRASKRVVVLDEVVPAGTRRIAEWAVYGLCGGAAVLALWFAFVVPI